MFEKEAEDSWQSKDLWYKINADESAYKTGFQDGYNKANEWHYVKDELPRKSDATLCELMPVFVAVKAGYNVSTYGTYWNLRLGKFECLDEVYAWCYAPEPPELPKEINENNDDDDND